MVGQQNSSDVELSMNDHYLSSWDEEVHIPDWAGCLLMTCVYLHMQLDMVELDEIGKPVEERARISVRRFAQGLMMCIVCTALVVGCINKIAEGLLHADTASGGATQRRPSRNNAKGVCSG